MSPESFGLGKIRWSKKMVCLRESMSQGHWVDISTVGQMLEDFLLALKDRPFKRIVLQTGAKVSKTSTQINVDE